MTHTATSLSSWVRAIRDAVQARGIDPLPLFKRAELDPALLRDPNARYPVAGTTRLWREAVAATGDPALGLEVGRHVNQTTFHALGYSLLASATLSEAFERLIRYFRVVSDGAELGFERSAGRGCFVMRVDLPGPQPADEALDAFAAVVLRLCRTLAGPQFRPLAVRLKRPQPLDRGPFDKVFRVAVEFAAPRVEIVVDATDLDRPLPAANPELARHNDQVSARYLAHLRQQNVANRVHALLVEQLPDGEPAQARIAEAMHMSLRKLQRRLAAEGTSYKAVLNQTRRDLALSYMADGRNSVGEIAFLLGFGDTSSFTRAFRRWTGEAPSVWRDRRGGA